MAHGKSLTLRQIRGTSIVGTLSPFHWRPIELVNGQSMRPGSSYRWARRREWLAGVKQGKKDWKRAQKANAGNGVGGTANSDVSRATEQPV